MLWGVSIIREPGVKKRPGFSMLTDALLCVRVVECLNADMAKLADAPDLGSGSERSEGSSPFIRIASNPLWLRHKAVSLNL